MIITESFANIGHNVLPLCVVADIENGTFNLALNLNRITNLEVTTEPAITQNGCYR